MDMEDISRLMGKFMKEIGQKINNREMGKSFFQTATFLREFGRAANEME